MHVTRASVHTDRAKPQGQRPAVEEHVENKEEYSQSVSQSKPAITHNHEVELESPRAAANSPEM